MSAETVVEWAPETADDVYEVRRFDPDRDRAGYLDLFERVFGGNGEAWFDWKYTTSPYVDVPQTVVAVTDGTVVGAKSAMAFQFGRGEETMLAIQPCDTMVHPDHRRRGVYSQLTEFMKQDGTDGEPALFFNFPNAKTLAGSLKHGWHTVGTLPVHYRIQNPTAFLPQRLSTVPGIEPGLRALVGRYRRLRDPSASDGVRVDRYATVPAETLAELYDRHVPERYHVVRDVAFYRWRFGNPLWQYTTYTASVGGEVEAAVVAGRKPVPEGRDTVVLTDVLPLPPARAPTDVYELILARVVADHQDADAIATMDDALPPEVRRRFGFRSNTAFPLSLTASPAVLVAYPLTETLGDDLYDASNWTVQFSDMDTR